MCAKPISSRTVTQCPNYLLVVIGRLGTETVESTAGALEGVHYVEGRDRFPNGRGGDQQLQTKDRSRMAFSKPAREWVTHLLACSV